MRKQPRVVSYVLKDESFPDFEIIGTSRGWWSDSKKIYLFIEAAKEGKTIKTCSERAGITKKQWRRFIHVHPGFLSLWRRCRDKVRFPLSRLSLSEFSELVFYNRSLPLREVAFVSKNDVSSP